MEIKAICKNTGYFCVGASVWLAEKTAQGAAVTAGAAVRAAKAMQFKGEAFLTQQRAAAAAREQLHKPQEPETAAS